MDLGNRLFQARKRSGLSQEEVAESIGVSRQTISKWETNETVPDIYQSKRMARLYNMSLDELISFDVDVTQIQEIIDTVKGNAEEKVDWTKAWAKKYPILLTYKDEMNIPHYASKLEALLNDLIREYNYSDREAFLVLKDILYTVWKNRR